MAQIVLHAADGMVLTDGSVFGKVIFPADGADVSVFREITDAEYEALTEREEEHGPV